MSGTATRRAASKFRGLALACNALALGSLAFCSAGCRQDDLFVMMQVHEVTDTEFGSAGHSCSNVNSSGSGSSGGGDESNDWWERSTTDSDGLRLVVGSFDQVLEDRSYDRDFLGTHAVDRFEVSTREVHRYAYAIWGGETCEDCPPDGVAPLPSNPWGCGDAEDAGIP